jgi:hypothetical protein
MNEKSDSGNSEFLEVYQLCQYGMKFQSSGDFLCPHLQEIKSHQRQSPKRWKIILLGHGWLAVNTSLHLVALKASNFTEGGNLQLQI